ncbi:MAG: twitch domain-containing radical SAM protein [Bdellovibrionaceae bacterium]|nr:twitch domain-containing radical SAM protein [Pseudobdellovibrionaceae bacterium]MBX3032751.1 twitch domain-containing radical SAM protein [Pseudobdellovibrionaceae bacterium]
MSIDEGNLLTPSLQAVKQRLDAVSPSFCLAKWKQVTLHLHNGNTQSCHHVKSHRVDRHEIQRQPSALHNTAYKMQMRRQMSEGQRPAECAYCWTMEDRGQVSDRLLKSADDWAEPFHDDCVKSGGTKPINPSYVEISFDSVCNFRCMYCSPAYSSSWMKEIKDHGPYPTSKLYNNLTLLKHNGVYPLDEEQRRAHIRSFWQWWPDLAPDLRHFRITGGEPFLAKETGQVLDWLVEHPQPQLNLAINSNFSFAPSKRDEIIRKANALKGRIKRLTFYTSVDTVGPRAEYIRFGLRYERFLDNVREVLTRVEVPITLSYMVTVNCLSLSGLKDLMGVVLSHRREFPRHHIGLDTPYLLNPEHLSVAILPSNFLPYLDDTLAFMEAHPDRGSAGVGFYPHELIKISRIRSLLEQRRYGPLRTWILRRDFYKMIQEYDRRKKTSFLETFPEYEGFYRLCRRTAWI